MKESLPKGFMVGTGQAAFRKAGREDLAIIYSTNPCTAAALFTTNLFCAAPVQASKEIIASGNDVRAIVANSGQANSCTGSQGLANCREIQNMVADALHIQPDEILLISTGVIGEQFDMAKWRAKLPEAIGNLGKGDAASFTHAIMTTDAFPKYESRELEFSKGKIRLCVMAKGAGMICPNMATMLCVALTDAKISGSVWQEMFKNAVNLTFNRVSVDGDTSTNDTIIGLANGMAEVEISTDNEISVFNRNLIDILGVIAKKLVQDGEGAKRIMKIEVNGARNDADAETVARAVGNSQLVKTAIYGGDANWGRIINAIGYSGVKLNPSKIGLIICGIERFRDGQPLNDELQGLLDEKMKEKEIDIIINIGEGAGSFTLITSDLGHEYVSLNADYRS